MEKNIGEKKQKSILKTIDQVYLLHLEQFSSYCFFFFFFFFL